MVAVVVVGVGVVNCGVARLVVAASLVVLNE